MEEIKKCRIKWHDTKEEQDVLISLTKEVKENDNDIFFYCNGTGEFWSLTEEDNGEDFTIVKVYPSTTPEFRLRESQFAFNMFCQARARYLNLVANQIGIDELELRDEDCDTGEDELQRVMWDYTTKHGELITGAFSKVKCDPHSRIFYFFDEYTNDWIGDWLMDDFPTLLQYIVYED